MVPTSIIRTELSTYGGVDNLYQEITVAKQAIDRVGIGCEPASASSLAGVKKLVAAGIIKKHEKVVCILTGNILKDTDAILKVSTNAVQVFSGDSKKLKELLASL